jgi:hypothetical protein
MCTKETCDDAAAWRCLVANVRSALRWIPHTEDPLQPVRLGMWPHGCKGAELAIFPSTESLPRPAPQRAFFWLGADA